MDLKLEKLLKRKSVYFFMIFWMALIGSVPRAEAMPVESWVPDSGAFSQRQEDLGRIKALIEKEEVREKLAEMGLAEDEIYQRLCLLDNDRIHELALDLEGIQAGADGGWILVILIILLIAIAVLHFSGYCIKIEPKSKEEVY